MNAKQRRKQKRELFGKSKPILIKDWDDLAIVPESKTHRLEIEDGCGWIHKKNGKEFMGKYLSTHTFYGSNYARSTRLLQKCGFNVTLANWDA